MRSRILLALVCVILLVPKSQVQAQWQLRGLDGLNVHSLFTNGSLTYAGTQTSGFYISTNDGATWTQQNNGLTNSWVRTFALNGSSLFAGTGGPAGVYLTTNNGTSWTIVNSGITNTTIHALAFNGATLLAGSNGSGVYKSTDNGASWQPSNTGLSDLTVHTLLATGGRIFLGAGSTPSTGGVFISTDNGASWSLPASSPTNIRSLTSNGTGIFAATNGTGVFKSTDNGASWSAASAGLTNTLVRVVISSGANLFAGTNGGGVYLSTNSGASWSPINTNLTNPSILSLAANSTTLYAGTQAGGVWTRPLSQVVAVDESNAVVPTTFRLEQNYPNPFNPTTSIGFRIPARPAGGADFGLVTLKVYDVLGREVATLVNDEKLGAPAGGQPGTYHVEWNAAGYSSGVYFYRLETNRFVDQRRMLLVK